MTNAFDRDELQQYLGDRITNEHLTRRHQREHRKATLRRREWRGWSAKLTSKRWLLRQGLKLSGLSGFGRHNALDVQTTLNTIYLPTLPKALDGLCILHMSDFHIDMIDGLGDRIVAQLQSLTPDLTLITGDFRDRSYGPARDCLHLIQPIADAISSECYAVLGNHDSLGLVPGLETMGINVLLNESASVFIGNDIIELAGVDDPSYFGCDDLGKATAGLSSQHALRILMAHSPHRLKEAAAAGFNLYLCGHTHGGQVCLPGGKPIMKSIGKVEWRYCSGNWQYDELFGYTSRGAGTSLAPVRFNCPPEITLHELRRG